MLRVLDHEWSEVFGVRSAVAVCDLIVPLPLYVVYSMSGRSLLAWRRRCVDRSVALRFDLS